MPAFDLGDLRYHDDVLVLLVRHNILALAWYNAPRAGHLLEVMRQVHAVHRATQIAPCLYNIVIRGTPRFPDEVREQGARLVRETADYKSTTAHVIEVDGLAGTAARMFLSTMVLLARHKPNVRVFGDHREAAGWIEASNGPVSGITQSDLLRMYTHLKSMEPKATPGG